MQSLTSRSRLALLTFAACCVAALPTLAGTVDGTVVFRGAVPNLPTVDMNADPQCANQHETDVVSPVLVLGEISGGDRTLGNVLVQITGQITGSLPGSALAEGTVVIDQVGCLYQPRVAALQFGQTLEVRNSDGIMHNVHFVPEKNDEQNLAMPPFLKQIQIDFAQPEPAFPVQCDIHPWMKAWVAVLDHPYFAVTGPDGTYSIEDLPAGSYTAVAWHEKLGTSESEVTVPADGSVRVDFAMQR